MQDHKSVSRRMFASFSSEAVSFQFNKKLLSSLDFIFLCRHVLVPFHDDCFSPCGLFLSVAFSVGLSGVLGCTRQHPQRSGAGIRPLLQMGVGRADTEPLPLTLHNQSGPGKIPPNFNGDVVCQLCQWREKGEKPYSKDLFKEHKLNSSSELLSRGIRMREASCPH